MTEEKIFIVKAKTHNRMGFEVTDKATKVLEITPVLEEKIIKSIVLKHEWNRPLIGGLVKEIFEKLKKSEGSKHIQTGSD